MAQVTGSTVIGDILSMDSGVAPILMGAGMPCVGCPSAQMETLAEAGEVHGMNIDKLVTDINNYLSSRN